MRAASQGAARDVAEEQHANGNGDGSRPPSSGLSSLGDRSIGDYDEMMDSL